MGHVLLQAASFTLIILVGILLRRFRVVPQDAGQIVKKLLINLTLPCAIIVNFSRIESVGAGMLLVVAIGICANVLMLFAGWAVTKGSDSARRVRYMLCLPAYNVGCFCLPFIQGFLPAMGTVTACMFDVGNSIMCTGMNYAVTAEFAGAGEKKGIDLRAVGKRLLSSPPLLTYVAMFLVSAAGMRLPEAVVTLVQPIASANTFTAMLMLGLLFHVEMKPAFLREIGRMLALRHLFAVAVALAVYFLLPLDITVRRALALIAFGPMSAVAPAYTGMCGGDEGMASAANSVSILLSIAELTAIMIAMGLTPA